MAGEQHEQEPRHWQWADRTPDPPSWYYQEALNERWPTYPRELRNQRGVKVRARVVWERDGETWIEGTATRWDQHHVLVETGDPRCATNGVWLAPEDVHREGRPEPGFWVDTEL